MTFVTKFKPINFQEKCIKIMIKKYNQNIDCNINF